MADCNRQRWGAVCDVVANVLLLLLLLPLQSWDERKGAMVPIMMIELHQGSSADEARTSLVEFPERNEVVTTSCTTWAPSPQ